MKGWRPAGTEASWPCESTMGTESLDSSRRLKLPKSHWPLSISQPYPLISYLFWLSQKTAATRTKGKQAVAHPGGSRNLRPTGDSDSLVQSLGPAEGQNRVIWKNPAETPHCLCSDCSWAILYEMAVKHLIFSWASVSLSVKWDEATDDRTYTHQSCCCGGTGKVGRELRTVPSSGCTLDNSSCCGCYNYCMS